jgi:hypothetical protein
VRAPGNEIATGIFGSKPGDFRVQYIRKIFHNGDFPEFYNLSGSFMVINIRGFAV